MTFNITVKQKFLHDLKHFKLKKTKINYCYIITNSYSRRLVWWGREHKLITREKMYDGLREEGDKQRVKLESSPPSLYILVEVSYFAGKWCFLWSVCVWLLTWNNMQVHCC